MIATRPVCAMMETVARDELYGQVVGQDKAISALEAAAVRPVHAYMFVGPPGTGKSAAAVGFAAALLCPNVPGGDGTCETCRRVLADVHPDVITVERVGPAISIDTAREVTLLAATSPLEGSRKVLILNDFHLVQAAGPALLKTIEEPPESTVFVVLAEFVPPELVTIASRCVRVNFDALRPEQVAATLMADGIEPQRAAELAEASGGRLDRARLLASDRGFEDRRRAWQSVPGRLDGTGATAAELADELLGLLESSVEPLRGRHDEERGRARRAQRKSGSNHRKRRRSGRGPGGEEHAQCWHLRVGRASEAGSAPAAYGRTAYRTGHPGRRLPGSPGRTGPRWIGSRCILGGPGPSSEDKCRSHSPHRAIGARPAIQPRRGHPAAGVVDPAGPERRPRVTQVIRRMPVAKALSTDLPPRLRSGIPGAHRL